MSDTPVIDACTEDVRRRLVPLPRFVAAMGRPFALPSAVHPIIEGDPRCEQAALRFIERLQGTPEGSFELRISCAGGPDSEEAYELTTDAEGVDIRARSYPGVVHALETLLQLVAETPHGKELPQAVIRDEPRFAWRGLLLDCARHFMPLEAVRRTIDGMALVKLNVLHWHLSDDQGFRVESLRFPRLHEVGSGGAYYTQSEVRGIVEYASERGVSVVPEFDLPGHCASWLAAYPELAIGGRPRPVETRWGIFDSFLDVTSERTFAFLSEFFAEMSDLFPAPWVHIGGDEVPGREWLADPSISAFMAGRSLAGARDLQACFTARLSRILGQCGKSVVGWEEIAHTSVPGSIVELYSGRPLPAHAGGCTYLVSTGFYLDHCRPASFHYAQEPLELAAGIAPELVIGAEACMWTEYVTPENLDSRLWPRLAAIAERFWSAGTERDADDVHARLETLLPLLAKSGITPRENEQRLLRHFAGEKMLGHMTLLAELVEPVKDYAREEWKTYTADTPLCGLVDAIAPESDQAWRLLGLARRHAIHHDARRPLEESFVRWVSAFSDPELLAFLRGEPDRANLVPLVERLAALGRAGLAIVRQERMAPSREEVKRLIAECSQPCAELLIAVLEPMRILASAEII